VDRLSPQDAAFLHIEDDVEVLCDGIEAGMRELVKLVRAAHDR
jgi:hypothetical protein